MSMCRRRRLRVLVLPLGAQNTILGLPSLFKSNLKVVPLFHCSPMAVRCCYIAALRFSFGYPAERLRVRPPQRHARQVTAASAVILHLGIRGTRKRPTCVLQLRGGGGNLGWLPPSSRRALMIAAAVVHHCMFLHYHVFDFEKNLLGNTPVLLIIS